MLSENLFLYHLYPLLCCELVISQEVKLSLKFEWTCLRILKIGFCVEGKFTCSLYLLFTLAVLWTGAPQVVSCLWMNMFMHTQGWIFFVEWKVIPSFTAFTHLLYCELVYSEEVSDFEGTCLWQCILKIGFFVEWNFCSFYFLYLLTLLWTGSLSVGRLPMNKQICAYSRLDFVFNENSFLLPPSPTCCAVCNLVHSQTVSCIWMNLLVHTQDWILCWVNIRSFFYLLYPLGALSAGKLPLNEHVCTYLKLNFLFNEICSFFYCLYPLAVVWTGALSGGKLPLKEFVHAQDWILCWVKFCSFNHLCPHALLWTGALSAGKLPLNEHVCAYSRLDLLLNENSFLLLPPLPTCCTVCKLVHSQTVSCLWMNMLVHTQVWIYVEWKFFSFTSFIHLLCCELVHSQRVSCLWRTCLCILKIGFCVEWKFIPLPPLPTCCVVNWQNVSCLWMNVFVHTHNWILPLSTCSAVNLCLSG